MSILQRYKNIFSILPSFGLDISDKSIKFVSLQTQELALDDFGNAVLPEGLIESGEIKDLQKKAKMELK